MSLSRFLKEQRQYYQDLLCILVNKESTEGLTLEEEKKKQEAIIKLNFITEIYIIKRNSHS